MKRLTQFFQNQNQSNLNNEEDFDITKLGKAPEEDELTSYTGPGWSGYYQGPTGYQGFTGYQGTTGYQDPNWVDPVLDKQLNEAAELILSKSVEIERRIEA